MRTFYGKKTACVSKTREKKSGGQEDPIVCRYDTLPGLRVGFLLTVINAYRHLSLDEDGYAPGQQTALEKGGGRMPVDHTCHRRNDDNEHLNRTRYSGEDTSLSAETNYDS
ncbi:hypothetical protein THAOC_17718, partial [Thalassiosira oceanica]